MKTIVEATGEGNIELHYGGYMFRRGDDGLWVQNSIGEGMFVSEEMLAYYLDQLFEDEF